MTMAAKYDKTVISLEIGHDRFLIFENVEPEPVSITKPTGFPNLPVDFAGFSVSFLAKRGL
jgi:hypothetical protein